MNINSEAETTQLILGNLSTDMQFKRRVRTISVNSQIGTRSVTSTFRFIRPKTVGET